MPTIDPEWDTVFAREPSTSRPRRNLFNAPMARIEDEPIGIMNIPNNNLRFPNPISSAPSMSNVNAIQKKTIRKTTSSDVKKLQELLLELEEMEEDLFGVRNDIEKIIKQT